VSDVTIRRMKSDEATTTALLLREVVAGLPYYNERAKSEELAKYGPEALARDVEADPDAVLVAVLDEQVVGFCINRYDDGLLWLSWFGVRPDARERGVGAALLAAFAATASRRRAHKLWCDTRTDNVRSQSVLSKAGFRKICTLSNHWYGQDFILWESPLE